MCTFGLKVVTEDQAPGMGGLTADYTVTPGVFFNANDSVETTLKTHIVAPVFVPEPRTWILLIMGAAMLFLAKWRELALKTVRHRPSTLARLSASDGESAAAMRLCCRVP